MIVLLVFAFLAGLVTILSPCIWPILPIVLSTSITGQGHKRPLGITLGVIISFAVLTLAISSLVKLFHFDPNILRLIAVIVIAFLGLSMLIPQLSKLMELAFSRLAGLFGKSSEGHGRGFWSGFFTGLTLGVIWSPCAGPILAAIATLAATGRVTSEVVFVTAAYVIGIGIPLFLFAYGGQLVFTKTRFISAYTGRIQQVFGVLMLLAAVAIYMNWDIALQAKLLNAFPQLNSTLNSFESNSQVKNQLNALKGTSQSTLYSVGGGNSLFNTNVPAPGFDGATKWLNTDKPLSLKDLKGKVVLVDFWTYTCINCIRTLPHVTAWYDKYKDQGFVVIGVHTPEFAFEHDTNNVQNAIKQFGIHYPVPQDNNYAIWNNFNNEYWPAEYLIDAKGNVRRTHFGEGEYDQTEQAIQALLKEAGQNVTASLETMPDQTPKTQLSPETYLGAKRMEFYYPDGNTGIGQKTFTQATGLPTNTFGLSGDWNITDENAITGRNAVLTYHFFADKVFLVLRPGSAGANAKVKVLIDNKPVDNTNAGQDVQNGVVTIDSDRLYNLIDLEGKPGDHTLRLEFQSPGTEVYAFTFG